jgi:menaquinone-dependent protoporphyrinogen oxidase
MAMVKKPEILVVYATKTGSTAEVAKAMAEVFKTMGAASDVFEAGISPAPDGYDAVVIGSAIKYGAWLSPAMDYIKIYKERLRAMPVAYFNCGIFTAVGNAGQKGQTVKYNDPAKALVMSVADTGFAGKIDYGKLNFMEKGLSKVMKISQGDRRDFPGIRKWAENIYPILIKERNK